MKLTKLTAEQEALLPQQRDKWIKIGLSTEPADRPRAEEGVRKAYRAAGLEPPRFILWLDSPLAGAYGRAMAPGIISDVLRRYDQVRGQVDGQVYDQVYGQVGDQVYDQVGSQVDDQVRGQVRGQVGSQVGGQVRDQVRDQVGSQVDDQVGSQVYGQVDDQVYDQVYGQVYDQVYGQVYDQVGGQVYDQVGGQVDGQVYDQVYDQVGGQVDDQVGSQVYDQVGSQVGSQVDDQVRDQVDDQVGDLTNWVEGLNSWGWSVGFTSWIDTFKLFGVTGLDPWDGQTEIVESSSYWWWSYRGFAILTERHTELHLDAQGRLHCETGPAVRYRDGFAVYAWHGTRVPGDLVETGWDVEQIMRERNAEIRRCAIEKVGWDALVNSMGLTPVATAPDPGNPGQSIALYDLPRQVYDEPVRLIVVANGTVESDGRRRRFGLTCPASISDPVAAAAWTVDVPVDAYRSLAARR